MSSFIPNSFQLPNALIDDGAMVEMKGAPFAIYVVIVRKTRGWQKEMDAISISQFVKFTGYGKDAVIAGAEKLVSLGFVERICRDHQPTLYSLSDLAEREIENLSENPTTANLSDKTTRVMGCGKEVLLGLLMATSAPQLLTMKNVSTNGMKPPAMEMLIGSLFVSIVTAHKIMCLSRLTIAAISKTTLAL